MKKYLHHKERGFTLVELIVAMGVFVTVITVSVGIFTQGLKAQNALVQDMALNSEIGIVLERMMREIRTGYEFSGDGDGSPVGTFIKYPALNYYDFSDSQVVYSLSSGAIERNGAPLTGRGVDIEDVWFALSPARQLCDPWRITIGIRARTNTTTRVANIQTSVSSRTLPMDLDIDRNGDNVNDYISCFGN
jgi:prepilin-type N-terminal cleavage/methylation domain-containing protein